MTNQVRISANRPGRIHIGTSGWYYRHWKGHFYPLELAARKWLPWYAQRFSCVEVNASFYRLPSPSAIREWIASTPRDFRFVVKASRMITHMKKLAHCEDALERFLSCIAGFGPKLGPVLFQLPPNWRANSERLDAFLDHWPSEYACVFEFRNPDWWREEIYRILDDHHAGFCQFQLADLSSPQTVTGNLAYLRLHGPESAYCGDYTETDLKAHVPCLKKLRDRGLDVFVFFDNDEKGYAAKNALTLKKLCG